MIRWFLLGGAVPGALLVMGGFYVIYLKGGPFAHPVRSVRAMLGGGGAGASPFSAVMLALAGTLGVGNLVGVANAIAIGGAGAIFWMWVSSLAAMILKYAEITLAVRHRRRDRAGKFFGGAVYYIRDCFRDRKRPRTAAVLGCVFVALIVLDALGMGCMIQSEAVGSALSGTLSLSPWVTGGVLLMLTLPFLFRGVHSLRALTEYLVPLMSVGYILLSVIVLVMRWELVGGAFASIFEGAFSKGSMGGGVIGFLTSRALRVGTMRGLLSNEAGCGTAPTAHASADAKSPASQGLWGIFEVFVDTILLCTATALVILVAPIDPCTMAGEGILMTVRAYTSVLGAWSGVFLAAAVFCFGYGTLLCWGHYGAEAIRALTGRKGILRAYYLLFGICILWGTVKAPLFVWELADFAMMGLTLINLFVLFLLRREVREESGELL